MRNDKPEKSVDELLDFKIKIEGKLRSIANEVSEFQKQTLTEETSPVSIAKKILRLGNFTERIVETIEDIKKL